MEMQQKLIDQRIEISTLYKQLEQAEQYTFQLEQELDQAQAEQKRLIREKETLAPQTPAKDSREKPASIAKKQSIDVEKPHEQVETLLRASNSTR